jgi:tetratricopeptide (TPR) repeat protein
MIDYSDFIDGYFNKTLSKDDVTRFEQMLVDDKLFAQEVAFYISTKQILKDQVVIEKKEWFRELLREPTALTTNGDQGRVRKLWIYRSLAAAAIIILLISSWYLFYPRSLPVQQTAERYIQKDLTTLPVTMGTTMDSMQQGLKLYNNGNLNESSKVFESILMSDSSNYSAKTYLGIIYLRLADYEKAFANFQQLANYPLYSNPATFYQALTLMKRNQSGDKPKARILLQKVVDENLEGKVSATQWLKKW